MFREMKKLGFVPEDASSISSPHVLENNEEEMLL